MESDSLSLYKIDEEEPLDYTFINRDGIKYHAPFYSIEPLYPDFIDTYSFSIEPEDKISCLYRYISTRTTHTKNICFIHSLS